MYYLWEYTIFINFLDSNTTYIVKDMFIIQTEDIHKKLLTCLLASFLPYFLPSTLINTDHKSEMI